jgi:ribose transport system permease protein
MTGERTPKSLVTEPEELRKKKTFTGRLRLWRGLPVTVLAIVLLIANEVLQPAFLTPSSLSGFFATYLPAVCIAIGISFALLVGGIDLSVGPVLGFSGIITVLLSSVGAKLFVLGPNGAAETCASNAICSQGMPFPLAALIGIAAGSLFGLLNGVAVAYWRLHPLMVTLATGFVAGGVSLWIFPQAGGQLPAGLSAAYTAGRIPPIGLIILVVVIGIAIAVMKSTLGVYMRADGSDRTRAFILGINVPRSTLLAYVVSGTFAGLGGVLFTLNVSSADPTVGTGLTLSAIAGAVLGGAALRGGVAEPIGPALGAISFGLLNTLVVSLNVPSYYQQLVSGIAIVLGLAATQRVFASRK